MRNLKRILAVILISMQLSGCYYDIPLVAESNMPIDVAVLGIWKPLKPDSDYGRSGGRVVVARYSDTEYLVHDTSMKEDYYYRAYLFRIAGMTLVQLQIIATDTHTVTDKTADRYYVVRYFLRNNELRVHELNVDVVSRNLKTSAALQKSFLANKNNKKLFKTVRIYKKVMIKN